ncbi:MAG: hypothetical protein D6715_13965 [Calditrichaeota bacterium]|nr:MAG: hypothetical protein D6715_13965 [Calditrichota bacterium]
MRLHREPASKDPHALFEEALALERQGAFREAFQLFRQCARGFGLDRGDVYFHLGWCLEQDAQPDWVAARKYYHRAAALSTSPVVRMNARFRAGWLFMQQRAHRSALLEFEKAVEEGEKAGKQTHRLYGEACYWYALMLEAGQRYLDALAWYAQVADGFPLLAPECRYRQIRCQIQVGDFAGALQTCRRFQQSAPAGFSPQRLAELKRLVQEEQKWLEACLQDSFLRDELS